MPKLTKTVAEMVAAARERIEEIDSDALKAMIDDPESAKDLVIVDIRDIRERQRDGFIPGSLHVPRGMMEFWVDPASPYHKPIFADDSKRFVLHCASGWRSALTAVTLQDMGFPAAHLTKGFGDWKKRELPIEFAEKKSG